MRAGPIIIDPVVVPCHCDDSPPSLVVNAGVDQAMYGYTFQLDGSVTYEGSPPGPLTYLWTQTGGPAGATFSDATILNPTGTLPGGGNEGETYIFTLTASAGELNGSDSMQMFVGPDVDVPPSPYAGPDQDIVFGDALQLDGSVTYEGSFPGPLTYLWTQTGGPAGATFSDATILNPTVTLPGSGTYVFTLTASAGLRSDSDSMQTVVA